MRSRPASHRVRQTLLWGIGVFLLGQIVLGLLLDHRWPLARFREGAIRLQSVANTGTPPDVLFLGSSRLRDGLNCPLAARILQASGARPVHVASLAVSAGDPVTMEYLLRLAEERGYRPRLVVVEVGPDLLNWSHDFFYWHVGRQMSWVELASHLPEIAAGISQHKIVARRLFPVYYEREDLLAALGEWGAGKRFPLRTTEVPLARNIPLPPAPPLSGAGAELPVPPSTNPAMLAGFERCARWTAQRWLRSHRVAGSRPQALDRLLACFQERGTPVLLLVAPVTRAYTRYMTAEVEGAFQEYVRSRCQRHGCELIDARDWVADGLFADHVHLTPSGATYFTQLLSQRVLVHRLARIPRYPQAEVR